jgi:hypothetical protein
MARLLRIAGWLWIWVALAFIAVGYAKVWWHRGPSALSETLSPFNVSNWGSVVITLAPGLLLLSWARRRKANRKEGKR